VKFFVLEYLFEKNLIEKKIPKYPEISGKWRK